MHIQHLKIENILGISNMELSPKGFTQISGPNGTGKTSVLESIKSVLTTGHDATLLRKGATHGEVVLVLDNGMELSKTVKVNGSKTEVRQDGKPLPRPAEAIKALTDVISVNPVDFLMAPKKERVRVLLEAMPLEADTDRLTEITGMPVKAAPGMHALHVIQQVHTQVYDERTGTNRAVKEKQATIKQLQDAVPPAPQGVEGDEAELTEQIEAIQQQRTDKLSKIDTQLNRMRAENAAKVQAIRDELQAKIDNLKAEATAQAEALSVALQDVERRAAGAREETNEKANAALQPINTQLQVLRNDREAAGRRKQTLETIGNLETELETLKEQSTAQTQALTDIEAYKSELLSSLPIPGLEVVDGEIMRDGITLDRLNTAQQVQIAVEVAKLRASDLGIVCVDGLELLDSGTLEAFRASALESGMQMFITRVSDTPSIETSDE